MPEPHIIRQEGDLSAASLRQSATAGRLFCRNRKRKFPH